jgi:hypothetical protein
VHFEIVGNIQGATTIARGSEIHWYEATGIGKREFKLKRILE